MPSSSSCFTLVLGLPPKSEEPAPAKLNLEPPGVELPKANPPVGELPATLAKDAKDLDADRSTPLLSAGFSGDLLPKMELPGGVLMLPKMEELEGVLALPNNGVEAGGSPPPPSAAPSP